MWRTDRQTDVKPIAITCFSIADARKNLYLLIVLFQWWNAKPFSPNATVHCMSIKHWQLLHNVAKNMNNLQQFFLFLCWKTSVKTSSHHDCNFQLTHLNDSLFRYDYEEVQRFCNDSFNALTYVLTYKLLWKWTVHYQKLYVLNVLTVTTVLQYGYAFQASSCTSKEPFGASHRM